MTRRREQRKQVQVKPKKTPRTRKPQDMSLEEWQRALRREYGQAQDFQSRRVGGDPIFSDFVVTNPASGGSYRVAIRGVSPGENYCSCADFKVNTLGTCKHIEWLLAKLARKRGGEKALREGFHPAYSEVYVYYGAKRDVRFRAGTACPEELRRLASRFFDAGGVLRDDQYLRFQEFVREAAKWDGEVRIYEDALSLVAQVRDDADRRQRIDQAFPPESRAEKLNKLLKVVLYPYQQEGALFAAKAGRCLLADDMGLGKTVQAIAAVEILARTIGAQRTLVVAPTALKYQWKQEVERFTERSAEVVEGFRGQRRQAYQQESFFKITNYDVVHRDVDLINEWAPDVVILDEAQRIKNWQTRRAKAVKQISSEHAIVLTGTPLENRLEELHSIMEFVDRFHLGPLFRFMHEHQHVDENGRVVGYRNLDRIGESLASVLVRRRKGEVLQELPERTDKHFFVDMTAEQWRHHDENKQTVGEIVAKWRRLGFLSDKDQRRLMISLQNMRMACNSSYLLDKETDHSVKLDECRLLLNDLLEVVENKVVIFSQWLGTHELLIRRLEPDGRPYAYYHGSLDSRARRQVIERFKKEPECRILMCTDSGGVGLNLQEASVVINMDQPWNPAVLEQRVGRVHRLGQHRHVQVHHFVSQGTIEHGMLSVIKFKAAVFAGVLDGGETEVFLGGSKMKKFMETVEQVSGHVPEPMPVHEERPVSAGDERAEVEAPEPQEVVLAAAAPATVIPWHDVLSAGMELLGRLGQAAQTGGGTRPSGRALQDFVAVSEKTGKPELRIPMPDADTTRKIFETLSGLADILRGISGPQGR